MRNTIFVVSLGEIAVLTCRDLFTNLSENEFIWQIQNIMGVGGKIPSQ